MKTLKIKPKYILFSLLGIACIVVAVLCIIKATSSIKYKEALSQSEIIDHTQIIFTADGGNGNEIPKNTIYAVDDLYQKGFTSIKIDARLTKDKKWVSLADEKISSVTNGIGKVYDYSYYELLNYNIKNAPETDGAVIELVQDTVQYAYNNGFSVIVYVHENDKAAIKELTGILSDINMGKISIASSDVKVLEYIEKIQPVINTIYCVDEITDEAIAACETYKFYSLCFNAANNKNTHEDFDKLFDKGIHSICTGADSLKEMEEMYQLGIRHFINDTVQIGDVQ